MNQAKPPVIPKTDAKRFHRHWLVLGAVILGATTILFFFPPEQYAFYPQCFFHKVTGWDCPGCGGLRAVHQLTHGHFAAAWKLNPLAVILLPLLAYEAAIRLGRERRWPTFIHRPPIAIVIILLLIGFGILRNLPASPLQIP